MRAPRLRRRTWAEGAAVAVGLGIGLGTAAGLSAGGTDAHAPRTELVGEPAPAMDPTAVPAGAPS
ncbi:hypothetical protein, partial [Georgenia thermotolerans]